MVAPWGWVDPKAYGPTAPYGRTIRVKLRIINVVMALFRSCIPEAYSLIVGLRRINVVSAVIAEHRLYLSSIHRRKARLHSVRVGPAESQQAMYTTQMRYLSLGQDECYSVRVSMESVFVISVGQWLYDCPIQVRGNVVQKARSRC